MKTLIAGLIVAAAFVAPLKAQQVQNCMAHETIVERLNTKYKEHVIGRGITAQGAVLEIYYSPAKQTWTLVLSGPNISCVIDAGEYWEVTSPKSGETES